jgi:hypothetical protein
MTEMEEKSSMLEEIRDIYVYLTEGEPSPDDEIEAQKELITQFKKLKDSNKFSNNTSLIKEILTNLEDWDTLEYWFIETSLPKMINQLLEVDKEEKPDKEQVQEEETISTEEKEDTFKSSGVNISEIVAQVSEQFKGEIDTLKEKIDSLQQEIKSKEETLQKIRNRKDVKTIKPHKKSTSKLPPLEIHLPTIKKAEEKSLEDAGIKNETTEKDETSTGISERKAKLEQKQQQYKEKLEVSLKQLEAIEKEMEEKIQEEQKSSEQKLEEESGADQGQIEIGLEPDLGVSSKQPINEQRSFETKGYSEETTLKPIPSEKIEQLPNEVVQQEVEKVSPPEPKKPKEKELTPIPQNKAKKKEDTAPPPPPKQSEIPSKPPTPPAQREKTEKPPPKPEVPQKTSLSQSQTSPQIPKEKTSESPSPPERPKISTMAIEEPLEKTKPSQDLEKSEKMKGIAEVEVEETDVTPQKTPKTDLFSVFSSMGSKTSQKTQKSSKSSDSIRTFIPGADDSKKIEKIPMEEHQKNVSQTPPQEPEYSEELESPNLDELPRDKDSLYQELIALEGKRYSIERKYKSLKDRYENGNIGENEFKSEDSKLKNELNEITKKITNIRRLLSSL